MWALARRHLRHQRWLILVMLCGLAVFEVVLIRVAAELDEGPGLGQMLGMLPGFVQDIVAAYVADISFASAVAVGFLDPASIVPCLALVILLASTPAADKETGAIDLYLTRPIARHAYLGSSIACAALVSLVMPLSLLLGCIFGLAVTEGPGEQPWTHYAMSAVALAALLLATSGITLLVACTADRRGVAVVKVVGVLVLTYMLEFLSFFWAPLEVLSWLSPFHYFKPVPGVLEGDLSPAWNSAVLVAVFAVTTALAFRRFERRDV